MVDGRAERLAVPEVQPQRHRHPREQLERDAQREDAARGGCARSRGRRRASRPAPASAIRRPSRRATTRPSSEAIVMIPMPPICISRISTPSPNPLQYAPVSTTMRPVTVTVDVAVKSGDAERRLARPGGGDRQQQQQRCRSRWPSRTRARRAGRDGGIRPSVTAGPGGGRREAMARPAQGRAAKRSSSSLCPATRMMSCRLIMVSMPGVGELLAGALHADDGDAVLTPQLRLPEREAVRLGRRPHLGDGVLAVHLHVVHQLAGHEVRHAPAGVRLGVHRLVDADPLQDPAVLAG